MTSLFISLALVWCALVYIAILISRIEKRLDDLVPPQSDDEPVVEPPTVTMGTYRPVNENVGDPVGDVGLVTTKTPQLLEFEEQQALEKMNLRPS